MVRIIDDTTNSDVVHASEVRSKCVNRLRDCSFVKNQSNASVFIGEEMRPFWQHFSFDSKKKCDKDISISRIILALISH